VATFLSVTRALRMDVQKGKTTINAKNTSLNLTICVHKRWIYFIHRRPPFAPLFSKRDTRASRSSLMFVLMRAVILSTISSAIVNTLVNCGTGVECSTDQQIVTYEHHCRIAPRNRNAATCWEGSRSEGSESFAFVQISSRSCDQAMWVELPWSRHWNRKILF